MIIPIDHRLEGPHKITISLGVSAFPESGATIIEAQNAADTALYEAKRRGRDQVVAAQ
jgi:diguanylate cyclase (GGDEF)-like protein